MLLNEKTVMVGRDSKSLNTTVGMSFGTKKYFEITNKCRNFLWEPSFMFIFIQICLHISSLYFIRVAVLRRQHFFPRFTRKLIIGNPKVCNFSIRRTLLLKLCFLESLGHCTCSEAIMTPLLRPLYIGTI